MYGYIFIKYHDKKAYSRYFERTCQEGEDLHIFDRVRMLKPP